jgi:hypothetical protein
MRRIVPFALSLGSAALAVTVALAEPTPSGPAATTPATAQKVAAAVHLGKFPVLDARGRKTGTASWRWTDIGGDCCETYLTTTPKGRVLEFGGVVPFYSDDRGKSWWKVTPTTPLYNGEGALVVVGDNVYGAGWDPYTGDHLQGFRYTGKSKAWEVSEVPMHSPFFDREWITYAKGPFTIGGTTYPFATIIRGGGVTKSLEILSGDGLDYSTPSIPSQEATSTEVPMFVPKVVKNPDADYWQPNPGTFTLPMTAGGVLLFNNGSDRLPCDAALLNQKTAKWGCVRLPWKPHGTVRQDSRGWLTEVQATKQNVNVGVSTDGGRRWRSIDIAIPEDRVLAGGNSSLHDVKVNGRLGIAAISVRGDNAKGGQDMVFVVDVKTAQPRLLRTYYVGRGDLTATSGLASSSYRFDFCSVAILPDGKLAVSFDDSLSPKHYPLDGKGVTSSQGDHSPVLGILL